VLDYASTAPLAYFPQENSADHAAGPRWLRCHWNYARYRFPRCIYKRTQLPNTPPLNYTHAHIPQILTKLQQLPGLA
jgi:hypothetical protein